MATPKDVSEVQPDDNWQHRSASMRCHTCMFFVPKWPDYVEGPAQEASIGRCRRHAPTMSGWPALFPSDWCGDHKLDAEKL